MCSYGAGAGSLPDLNLGPGSCRDMPNRRVSSALCLLSANHNQQFIMSVCAVAERQGEKKEIEELPFGYISFVSSHNRRCLYCARTLRFPELGTHQIGTTLRICLCCVVENRNLLAWVLPTLSPCPTYTGRRATLGRAWRPVWRILTILTGNDRSLLGNETKPAESGPSSFVPFPLSRTGTRLCDFMANIEESFACLRNPGSYFTVTWCVMERTESFKCCSCSTPVPCYQQPSVLQYSPSFCPLYLNAKPATVIFTSRLKFHEGSLSISESHQVPK